jgi:hypothetical protein
MTEPTAPDDDTRARLVKLLDVVEATPTTHRDLRWPPAGFELLFLFAVGVGTGALILLLNYNWLFSG